MAMVLRGCGGGHRRAVSSSSFLSTYLWGASILRDANQVRLQSVYFHSTKTRPLLQDVRDQCRSGNVGLEEGLSLFNSMIVMKYKPPTSDFDQLLQAISSNSKSSDVEVFTLIKVMSLFRIKLSIVTVNMLMDCCCRTGQFDLRFCMGIVLRLGLAPNDVTWSTLFAGLIAQGCRKHPRDLLLSTVIAALNDTDADGGLHRCFKDVIIDQKSTNLAKQLMQSRTPFFFHTCLLRGLLMSTPSKEDSSILFDMMIAHQGFPDSPPAYSALNNALSHQGMITEAQKLLDHMITKKNRVKEANELLDQMMPTPPFLQQNNSHSEELAQPPATHSDIYYFLLSGMCKARKLRQATQLFDSLSALGVRPNTRMYNSMLSALCKQGKFGKAVDLLKEMREKRLAPNDSTFDITLQEYLEYFSKAGKMLGLLSAMRFFMLRCTIDKKTLSSPVDEWYMSPYDRNLWKFCPYDPDYDLDLDSPSQSDSSDEY